MALSPDQLQRLRDLEELDQLRARVSTSTSPSEPGQLESLARGAAQGATLGFADELTGAGEAALVDPFKGKIGSLDDLLAAYRQHRDESRAAYKAAQEANPLTYGAGELAGGIAMAPLLGAGEAVQGANVGAKILGAAKAGAAIGAAGALGGSEADVTQGDIAGAAKDTLEGAGLGAAGGAAFEAVAPTVSKAAGDTLDYLKNLKTPGYLADVAKRSYAGESIGGLTNVSKYQGDVESAGKSLMDTARESMMGAGADLKAQAFEKAPAVDVTNTVENLLAKGRQALKLSPNEDQGYINAAMGELEQLGNRSLTEEGAIHYATPSREALDVDRVKSIVGNLANDPNVRLGPRAQDFLRDTQDSLKTLARSGMGDDSMAMKLATLSDKAYSSAIDTLTTAGLPLSGRGTSPDAIQTYEGALKTLKGAIEDLSLNPNSSKAASLSKGLDAMQQNLLALREQELTIASQHNMPEEFLNNIRDKYAARSNELNNVIDGLENASSNLKTSKMLTAHSTLNSGSQLQGILGISAGAVAGTGTALAGKAAGLVGRALPEAAGAVGAKIYNLSPSQLQNVADYFVSKGSAYGAQIKAAMSQPESRRNALLFSLAQTPGFREEAAGLFGEGEAK